MIDMPRAPGHVSRVESMKYLRWFTASFTMAYQDSIGDINTVLMAVKLLVIDLVKVLNQAVQIIRCFYGLVCVRKETFATVR